MAKAKFTEDQLDEAVAEFFCENIPPVLVPGAGQNGPIIVYKKEEVERGPIEIASE
jgi:hypothetical protein